MAERKGGAFRFVLLSADRLSDIATSRGSLKRNTPGSRASALLVSVTCCDQRRPAGGFLRRATRGVGIGPPVGCRRLLGLVAGGYETRTATANPSSRGSIVT